MTVVAPLGLSVQDRALEADVEAGLAAVEEGLLEATKSDVPFITEAARHLVRAGGKRFRPCLSCSPRSSAIRTRRASRPPASSSS